MAPKTPESNTYTKERKQIRDLKLALKDFESMVKDPKWLINGREITNFSLRPREVWANWLLCAVISKSQNRDMTFMEATQDEGDGFLLDRGTGEYIVTEHVCALDAPGRKKPLPKGEERVIREIEKKIARGIDYAKNKTLVVFFDGAGTYYRKKIRESIRDKHHFDSVYAVGLIKSDASGYRYSVTQFDYHDSITYMVVINSDATDLRVSELKDMRRVRVGDGSVLSSWIQEFPL